MLVGEGVGCSGRLELEDLLVAAPLGSAAQDCPLLGRSFVVG